MEFELGAHGEALKVRIGADEVPAVAQDMYASGGEAYLVVECAGRKFRIALGSDWAKIFDFQRRRIDGIVIRGDDIVFQRAFLHRSD